MTGGRGRGAWLLLAVALGFALAGASYCADPQKAEDEPPPPPPLRPNERDVKPLANVLDSAKYNDKKGGGQLWVLNFRFKDPRLIKVDVPGRGQKVCWYLWYQVWNESPVPVTFNPEFELVTQDRKNLPKRDQILPSVQDAIIKIEDPHGYLKIKNSVTIAADPIPPRRPNAEPTLVTGVAIWDDVDPESNYFDIYIAGLSNGYNVSYPVGREDKPVVLRKTLQLKFRRLGDRYLLKSEDIRFLKSEWMYRASNLSVPEVLKQPAKEQ
jgi:hypothetical protein